MQATIDVGTQIGNINSKIATKKAVGKSNAKTRIVNSVTHSH